MLDVMQFARSDGSGRTVGHISNKTLHIAPNYREQAARIHVESLDDISREFVSLMEEPDRLEYFASLLEPRQEKVLRLICFEWVPLEMVVEKLGVTVCRVQNIRSQTPSDAPLCTPMTLPRSSGPSARAVAGTSVSARHSAVRMDKILRFMRSLLLFIFWG